MCKMWPVLINKIIVLAVILNLLGEFEMVTSQRSGGGLNLTFGQRNSTGRKKGSGLQIGGSRSTPATTLKPFRRGGINLGGPPALDSSGGVENAFTTKLPDFGYTGPRDSLSVGLIVPHSMFYKRDYTGAVTGVMSQIQKFKGRYKFFQRYNFTASEVQMIMITVSPGPRDILDSLCEKFLMSNISAIMYLTNNELYGRSTAASQYFLQLAGYLGIPVIAWNADNSGLLRRASQSEMILQLAPSVQHQASAMLSILIRYNWHQFAIVTSQIAGHDDFVQAVRDRVLELDHDFKFIILTTVMVVGEQDLLSLVGSEARILLLYCTREEAREIFKAASKLGLTGSNFVWIVTQSAIGNSPEAPPEFPVGMLGVHFNTSYESVKAEISTVLRVYVQGVEAFVSERKNLDHRLSTSLSCHGLGQKAKWSIGDLFFRYLRNVTLEQDANSGRPTLKFNQKGTLEFVDLKIMNLRPRITDLQLVWEQIGLWQNWKDIQNQLDIRDIVWPGYNHKPPDGVPERFHLKISFLDEAPYIKMADPDPVTGRCSPDRGVLCRIASDVAIVGLNHSEVIRNSSFYQCCSGFCIDLLVKFSEDIGFTYELVRVQDAKWGTLQNNGKWNGLISELINRKTDVAFAPLMINSERESVVDFSLPFMDSGIAILTAKRTGIISPTAFLEPFDPSLWMLVGIVGINVYSFAIFFFEWLSPMGFNMRKEAQPGAQFSLCRSFWLVWARLFQASVHIDPPKGWTAKLLVHLWSMFSHVLLATYTANLAVFMITREESHKFTGIHDPRLSNPRSQNPPMKFATVPNSHTDSLLKEKQPDLYGYLDMVNNVTEGVLAVRRSTLDAFIYDGPILQYQALQDSNGSCELLIEGKWYAHTGYGIAFPRHSKHLPNFNKYLMEYKENGDLERLKRFYFTGPCSPTQRDPERSVAGSSNPLALEQFLSAFFLLSCGIGFACILLCVEKLFSKWVRAKCADKPPGCFSLVSQNMGLRPFNMAHLASTLHNKNKQIRKFLPIEYTTESNCDDPGCKTNLLRSHHNLKMALFRCTQLETQMRMLSDPKFRATIKKSGPRNIKTFSEQLSICPAPLAFQDDPSRQTIAGSASRYNYNSTWSGGRESPENQPMAFKYRKPAQLNYQPSLTEIAEIETVL